jgi:hypothetical protein
MPPPIGTLVHELGHNWLGKADIAVQTILLAIGFVTVGLRLWSRRLQGISWQGNDWLIVVGTVRETYTGLLVSTWSTHANIVCSDLHGRSL